MAIPDLDDAMDAWRKAVLDRFKNNVSSYSLLHLMTPRQQGKTFVWRKGDSDGEHRPPVQADNGGADPSRPGGAGTAQRAGKPITATEILANIQALRARSAPAYDPHPPPLPREGVRVGEIIGWRAWRAMQFPGGWCLKSLVLDICWHPGRPMTGDPSDHGKDGVNAFRTREAVLACDLVTLSMSFDRNVRSAGIVPVVIGTVALWGDVVEHQHGYRASHGAVHSLDQVIGMDGDMIRHGNGVIGKNGLLAELRQRYGVE